MPVVVSPKTVVALSSSVPYPKHADLPINPKGSVSWPVKMTLDGQPLINRHVLAFNGTTPVAVAVTDATGVATFDLDPGTYTFILWEGTNLTTLITAAVV